MGLHFWQIGLIENIYVDKAKEALIDIANSKALLPLLNHEDVDVCLHTAEVLAAIGFAGKTTG